MMAQQVPLPSLEMDQPSLMPAATSSKADLNRQGSIARTNAIAKLKRAASQREMRANPQPSNIFESNPSLDSNHQKFTLPLPQSALDTPSSSLGAQIQHDHSQPGPAAQLLAQPSTGSMSIPLPGIQHHTHDTAFTSPSNRILPDINVDTQHPPPVSLFNDASYNLSTPADSLGVHSNGSSDLLSSRSRSPMFPDRAKDRSFNRSPLPSLEQLRARILLERESAGLQRSASTSAASQAARAYALEKLLGNSGSDVFYDQTRQGTLIGRGAATPSPTDMMRGPNSIDTASDDEENKIDFRPRRQDINKRVSLRRSRTVNGLSAMAEAQRKAEFVQGVFLAVPGPASKRISRIHQRRVERQSVIKATPVAQIEPVELPAVTASTVTQDTPGETTLSRSQSQRQIARTEMIRKLSTRGRNASSTTQHVGDAQPTSNSSGSAQVHQLPLPRTIIDSPAVDESISPVGVVIRPPSSPAPPPLSSPDLSRLLHAASPAYSDATSASYVDAVEAASSAVDSDDHQAPSAVPSRDQMSTGPASATLQPSSSTGSLASQYAQSNATNATAIHVHERNRESAMALLTGEDSFALEHSLSSSTTPNPEVEQENHGQVSSTSVNRPALHSASSRETIGQQGIVDARDHELDLNENQDPGHLAQADVVEGEGDMLETDFVSARRRRRAGLVGLGFDPAAPVFHLPPSPSQTAQNMESIETHEDAVQRPILTIDPAPISSELSNYSPPRRSPGSLQPLRQDTQSSVGSYSDDDPLEDDAFYKLYSPVARSLDGDEDEDGQEDKKEDFGLEQGNTDNRDGFERREKGLADAEVPSNKVFDSSPILPIQAPLHSDAEAPFTPQRLPHRSSAAVPCDPSPSTETDFGETRRSQWVGSSPNGVTVPLRFSNSLISAVQTVNSDLTSPDAGRINRDLSRKTRGDWPISVSSTVTVPISRESLENSRSSDGRGRLAGEGAHTVGSPLIEVPEDDAIRDGLTREDSHAILIENNTPSLLSVPGARPKASDRLNAILGSSFVKEYADDLDFDARSRSSFAADDAPADNPGLHGLGVGLDSHGEMPSPLKKDVASLHELSDGDGVVDEAYLRKVDRIANKLRNIAKANKSRLPPSTSAEIVGVEAHNERAKDLEVAGPNHHPSWALEASTTKLDAEFEIPAHSTLRNFTRAPSNKQVTGLAAFIENEKLNPFPGLSQKSPVQTQDGFKPMAMTTGPSSPLQQDSFAADSSSSRRKEASSTSLQGSPKQDQDKDRRDSPGKQIGLFSSLRRKASSLRRNPSLGKGGGLWSRKNASKSEDASKSGTEPMSISAPIPPATSRTAEKQDSTSQAAPHVPPKLDARPSAGFEEVVDMKMLASSTGFGAVDLQRNPSISSVVSARIHPDLQDGTADVDSSWSKDPSLAVDLPPSTAAMLRRYSRILSASDPTIPIPGVSSQDMRDPPRKLLLADPVFQVISTTTIKDRFLFLLNDLLIIAKPVAAPGLETSRPLGKMKDAAVLPSLDWRFAVKNILEVQRLKVSITSNSRTATAKTRASNPQLWSFITDFSKDADAALRSLVSKTGLDPSPASTAQVLYQTPELDRTDLTKYLTHPGRRELLKAYIGQHRYIGVSIESALRSLLLDLRFPIDLDAFEALLVYFSQSWTQHNAAMIKPDFTPELASDLVFAIMSLNDALHTNAHVPAAAPTSNFSGSAAAITPGLFSGPCYELSKEDFVTVFRQHDPHHVLSDRTLSRIYLSIKSEPLVQALDRHEPRFTIRIKGGKLPTRLTYAQPAEPVTLVIPSPDPDLAIRLYAQDTTFEPAILTFGNSREASFTMWSKSLGPKQVVFVRAGRNARYYGGSEMDMTNSNTDVGGLTGRLGGPDDCPLPRSFDVTVERAFMKHSFTLTSIEPGNSPAKRFMFSFEDAMKMGTWTSRIKESIESCIKQKALQATSASTMMGVKDTAMLRATEALALQILRDALVVPDDHKAGTFGTGARPGGSNIGQSGAPGLNRAATVTGTTGSGNGLMTRRVNFQQQQHQQSALVYAARDVGRSGSSGDHLGLGNVAGAGASLRPQPVLDRAPSTSKHYYAASGVGRHERELLIPSTTPLASNISNGGGDAGAAAASTTSLLGLERGHTKGSASLSLYPPSTATTRGLGDFGIGRTNSARSASTQHHATQNQNQNHASTGDSNIRHNAASSKADIHASGSSLSGASPSDSAAKRETTTPKEPLTGLRIVEISRLNSLLPSLLAKQQSSASAQSSTQDQIPNQQASNSSTTS